MREIKFRVWWKNPQALLYNISSVSKESVTLSDGRGLYKDYLLMQYTGLKDKNGKEIYEGDIVIHYADCWNGRENISVKTHHLIIYKEEDAAFIAERFKTFTKNYGSIVFYGECFGECEVIGNIYENPELLEKEQ